MIDKERKFVVGVIGTQNTGKSTFIRDIIEQFKDTLNEFKTVGCDYRKKVEEAGLAINRNGDLRSQNIILDTLIEQLDIIKSMPDGNYLTDRSPIDAYVYTKYLKRHNPDLGITDDDVKGQFEKVKNSISTYDRIIFLDLDNCANVEVVDDKFRDTDLDFRCEIDKLFKETIDELGPLLMNRLNRSIRGTREERVEQFLEMEGAKFAMKIPAEGRK